ncbi:MAG: DUF1311 domain-containing protein [Colwellia sp.]
MIKKIITLTLFTCSLLSAIPTYAAKTIAECEKKGQSEAEHSRCLDSVKEVVERELQTWVNNHVFNLEEKALVNGRYSALKMFKRSQSNFITFRENDCRWQYLVVSPERGAGLAYKKCYVLLTQTRIKELSIAK